MRNKTHDGKERILVIKLGALGDIVLCFQAFQSIRRAHGNAEIAMLTMPAFAGFAASMPWFNKIIADTRPKAWQLSEWDSLLKRVREFSPSMVYDFQGKTRQSALYAMLGGPFGTKWSGAAPLCSHPRPWPPTAGSHYTDFISSQLRSASVDIVNTDEIDTTWLDAPITNFMLPDKYVLLIPGCASSRTYKRWPVEKYAELARRFSDISVPCIAIGTLHDEPAIRGIVEASDGKVMDLSGRTSLPQVAAIARRALYVIGNDTGPTHLAAAVGGNVTALISEKVNPVWSSPRGKSAAWLQGNPLKDLSVEEVWKKVTGV